ncbi:MAG: hypothetical protein HA494_02065 [Thaumarchaeota archaeon]|nr:hypothetical protein [Nitrososphaerota archaeon]
MRISKSGAIGLAVTAVGVALLLFTFYNAYLIFSEYQRLTLPSDFLASVNEILVAAIRAMFLAVMAWVGSILLLRGVDFLKVDRGVGVVTFKVEKGVGIATMEQQEKKSE